MRIYEPIQPAEIVPLLRSYCEDDRHAGNGFSAGVHTAAADEIERLRAEVDRLRQRRYELLHEVAELRQEHPA